MREAYFDTCIISGVAKRDLPPPDQEAVHGLIEEVQSSNLTVSASTEVRGELLDVPRRYRDPHLEAYDHVKHLSASTQWLDPEGYFTDSARSIHQKLRTILPDKKDARHITHAAMHSIPDFVTTDRKTILRYREEIREASGVSVWDPQEYLSVVSTSS